MTWLLLALLATLFYSATNIIDKHLIDRRFQNISATTITSLAALSGIPFLVILLVVNHFSYPSFSTTAYGFLAGWLVLAAYQLYYMSLRHADAALITSLYQFILPFNYLLGLVFLKESITTTQVVGLLLIVCAATVTAAEEREGAWKLRLKVLLLMIIASLLISVSDLVFKKAAHETPFLQLATAEYLSTIVAGSILLVLPKVRKELMLLRGSYGKVLTITQSNEILNLGGMLALRFALTLGPIALVQGIMGAQPIVVLIMAMLLSTLFPHLRQHTKKSQKKLSVELAAMLVLMVGGFLVAS